VLLDVGDYESLLDQLEVLRDVQTAEDQLKKGRSVSHSKARANPQVRGRWSGPVRVA